MSNLIINLFLMDLILISCSLQSAVVAGRSIRDGGDSFHVAAVSSPVFSPSYAAALPISLRLLTSPMEGHSDAAF
jgi:hypothetical protein